MDNMLYLIIMWAMAIMYIVIGVFSMNKKKPTGLWAGSRIFESRINDVKAYNRSVGKMWCAFAILFFLSGIVMYFSPIFSIIIFALVCTVGIGESVWCYYKIEEKYFIK